MGGFNVFTENKEMFCELMRLLKKKRNMCVVKEFESLSF